MKTKSNHLPRKAILLGGLLGLCLSSACSVFGNNGEVKEPDYRILKQDDVFSLRQYDPMIVAEVQKTGDWEQASSKGFRPLFEYIEGQNQSRTKIAMTTPVLQSEGQGEKIPMTAPVFVEPQSASQVWSIAFVLPSSFTMETTPRPLNSQVKIVPKPARQMAVIRFSGVASPEQRQTASQKLQHWALAQGFLTRGKFVYAGYNPPFTLPPFRRNEMMIEVIKND